MINRITSPNITALKENEVLVSINLRFVSINELELYISDFINRAIKHPELIFLLPRMESDYFSIQEIAPLFYDAIPVKNIHLPVEFWDILNEKPTEEEIRRAKRTILGI